MNTGNIQNIPDEQLINHWNAIYQEITTGSGFSVRGWYHLVYADILRGKKVLDVGSGLGFDGIAFAKNGAHITFMDIAESNLAIIKRLCRILHLHNVDFVYLENIETISSLKTKFDVIWSQGSLITAPFQVIRSEVQALLEHLPIGGRWIELAYPRERWEREGSPSFDQWGMQTDGGAPWIEWYDLDKVFKLLEPAQFDVVFAFNFHNDDFNWFDLIRRK